MSARASALERREKDTRDVLRWLRLNPGREVTYRDLSLGTGIPEGARLRQALKYARIAAHDIDARVESMLPARGAGRAGTRRVTRYNPPGGGDEFGARDAMFTARRAISAMQEMKMACDYEATNTNGTAPEAFSGMAEAVGGCISAVAGVKNLGEKLLRSHELRAAEARAALEAEEDYQRQIAELEAELARRTGVA